MNRLLLLALLGLFAVGCQSEAEKEAKLQKDLKLEFKDKITTYLKSGIAEDKDDIIVDSVIVLKVDTLTELLDSLYSANKLFRVQDQLMKEIQLNREQSDNYANMAKLSRGLDGDLFEMYKSDALEYLNKSKELLEQARASSTRTEKIEKLIDDNKLDTVKLTGYGVLFHVKARDSKHVAKDIDSGYMRFDIDKRILEDF